MWGREPHKHGGEERRGGIGVGIEIRIGISRLIWKNGNGDGNFEY